MKNLYLYSALALALAMTLIHVFVGGRLVVEPLLASELGRMPRLTLYLCWHGITIVLAGMALLAADALFWRKRADAALLLAGLSGAFTMLIWFAILRFSVAPLDLPQWIVFMPLSVFSFLGARGMQRP